MSLRLALIGRSREYCSAYGRVYRRTAHLLNKDGRTQVRAFFDSGSASLRDKGYSGEQMECLSAFDPHIVFLDPGTMDNPEKSRIGAGIAARHAGQVERIESFSDGEITFKDGFYFFCLEQGIPTPKTIVLKNYRPGEIRHKDIAEELDCDEKTPLVYKNVLSSGGRGVFLTSNEEGLRALAEENNPTDFIVQRRISVGPIPFSMRVITFGPHIIGGALLINRAHLACSNAHQGGLAFDLSVPEEKMERGNITEQQDRMLNSHKYWHVFKQSGVSPFNRRIPVAVANYAVTIGKYPGNCLLRGTDFIFDKDGNPYALETNIHPGPPGTGMWLAATGRTYNGDEGFSKEAKEVKIAAELIARTSLKYAKMRQE